jgi:uncharacterized membrane protein
MTVAGLMHFLKPRWYMRIIPPYLPAHRELVYASGVAEIAGALGTMHPRTRRPAGLFLIATLLAVFPANVHMAVNARDYRDLPGGEAALWARLPFQGLFIYWVWRATRRG